MANPFLNKTDLMDRDVETALMLEKAIIHNIGSAVAYTDGKQVYVNTDDNLFNILPAYDYRMLKWILWHERFHLELKHHNRFFKYIDELNEKDLKDEFHVTKEEVNIIMDILVHDSLSRMFPELVETAVTNLAQMRNRNSLEYTFKTYTLEEMLDEYAKFKHKDDKDDKSTSSESEEDDESEGEGDESSSPSHEEGDGATPPKSEHKKRDKSEDKIDEGADDKMPEPTPGDGELPSEHDKTDWSKLDEIDTKEFITEEEANEINRAIAKLKRTKLRLAKLTETLNGLVTSVRKRTYSMPSTISVGGGVILKGSTPGRAQLYLIFDASGSMSGELELFRDIISKSIPQAMLTPCEWFAGYGAKIEPYKVDRGDGYYKGQFKDIVPVGASSGYSDDGDRTIDLCLQAEQKGFTPIGVTDGGGGIYWSHDKIKQLKRTILIGHNKSWLNKVKSINPSIQTLYVDV